MSAFLDILSHYSLFSESQGLRKGFLPHMNVRNAVHPLMRLHRPKECSFNFTVNYKNDQTIHIVRDGHFLQV